MKHLVFDTETTGLPIYPSGKKIRYISKHELDYWPHIIQLSYIIYDDFERKIIKEVDEIIKIPESVEVSEESFNLHGICKNTSLMKGKLLDITINEFIKDCMTCDKIIGHNIRFDLDMIKVSLLRMNKVIIDLGYNNKKDEYYNYICNQAKHKFHCTLMTNTERCNIIGKRPDGTDFVKWPKLSELYTNVFNESVPESKLHNAFIDVIVCLRCYLKIQYECDVFNENVKIKNYVIK